MPPARSRFAKHDRLRLAWLVAEHRPTASLLIAYPPGGGQADTLVARLRALGAQVRYQADTLGYLRVELPTARVREAAALPGIDAVTLNGALSNGALAEPEVRGGTRVADSVRWRVAPPDTSTPAENPYLPMRDVGAPQFVRAHPTFDGRGITIGSVECCVDFGHPVFQEPALTQDGKPTRKIAALFTVVADDSEATNRVHARDWVEAARGTLTYEGVTYHAPRDGRFRIGYYAGPTGFKMRANWRADTLDAPARGRAVLLDPRAGEAWLDGLDDHDFSHDRPLREYNATGDVGFIGRDDPATPWDDRLTFAVGIDTARGVIDVYPGDGGHITGVAGTAVGTHFYGSRATGAAPNARMVLVWQSGLWKGIESYMSSQLEAMILLARRPDIDIITLQKLYGLRLKDGGSVWSIIADRLVTTYHKILFESAGNEGPGLGTVGEVIGPHVMKVGGSVHRDTWYAGFALLTDRESNLIHGEYGGASGPDAAGGTSPDFLGPFAQLIAQPMGTSSDSVIRLNKGQFSSQTIYQNPPGYTLQFGTSLTAPTAAGSAALLLSAAHATGVPADAARLRWALSAGARYIPWYQAHEQGAGLLNVPAAWTRLQHAPAPVEVAVDAPVHTVMSPYLRTPGHGRGLYEREGWVAGDRATRLVTLTRTSGPAGPIAYRLRWLGNDGTFASQPSVTLDLNRPASVPVAVHPHSWGVHSALLQLVGADGVTPAQQMSAVVVAAHPLDAGYQYTLVTEGRAEWMGKTSYFVAVPPGAAALNLTLAIGHGAVRFVVCDPTGSMYPSMVSSLHGRLYGLPDDIAVGRTQQQSSGVLRRTIEYPEPGVWEIVVEHEGAASPELRMKRQTAATFTLAASVTKVTGHSLPTEKDHPALIDSTPVRVTLHSDFAPVTARLVGGVASVARESLSFQQSGAAIVRELTVDSGTTRISVGLSHPSDSAADIDVHIFDCTSGRCDHYVSAVFQGADKELRVQHPRPGRWRIVIDPYLVPSGATTIEYRDEIVHPKYGTATVPEPLVHLPPGGTATVGVVLQPGVQTEAGRTRVLYLEVESTQEQSPSGPADRGGTRYRRGVLGVARLDL